ncbi:MAG: NAD-dependent epimerase/dehydratase family protein [Polyangia bacterium]|jgi:dihydroflavonol-4-reductase
MKILVTGAPGFLGSPLLEGLCQQFEPKQLRLLAVAPAPEFSGRGVEVQVGSILTPADVARALEDVTHVYHLAGFVSRKPADGHRMFQIHVHGTRLLCEAALHAGVKRILMVSTSGTIAVSKRADEMPDEDSPTPLELISGWPYYASKLYQEQTARLICGDRIELVTVNPSLLLGPGDVRMGSTRDVLSFLAGDVKLVPSGGINFVDARDVAAIIPVAMDKGRPGERYLLGGHNMTFAEYFDRIERTSKEYHPRFKAHGRWPVLAAKVQSAVFKAAGRSSPIEPASVDMASYFWYFDSTKARSELGFAPREACDTIFDTIRFIRENALGKGVFAK